MIAARQAKRAALAGDKNGEQVHNDYLHDPPVFLIQFSYKMKQDCHVILHFYLVAAFTCQMLSLNKQALSKSKQLAGCSNRSEILLGHLPWVKAGL